MPLSNADRIKIHQILRPIPLPVVTPAWTFLPSAAYFPYWAGDPSSAQYYQPYLPPPPDPIAELDALITNLIDLDRIAAIQACFARWDAIQLARNPNKSGLIKADVVEWDTAAKSIDLNYQEGNVRSELAIALGWQITTVFPF